MTEIRRKLGASARALALALTFALAGLVGTGCVDHSGDKTYPRADGGLDTALDEDAPATSDAPGDVPATDSAAVDTAGVDTAAIDTAAGDTRLDTGLGDIGTGDVPLGDVRLDVATGG